MQRVDFSQPSRPSHVRIRQVHRTTSGKYFLISPRLNAVGPFGHDFSCHAAASNSQRCPPAHWMIIRHHGLHQHFRAAVVSPEFGSVLSWKFFAIRRDQFYAHPEIRHYLFRASLETCGKQIARLFRFGPGYLREAHCAPSLPTWLSPKSQSVLNKKNDPLLEE